MNDFSLTRYTIRHWVALVGMVIALSSHPAQALTLSAFDQAKAGHGTGVLILNDLDYSITQIGVQITLPNSQVDFELVQKKDHVRIEINDPHVRYNDTLMSVAVITDQSIIHREFVIKGSSNDKPKPQVIIKQKETIALDYEALPISDEAVPENALAIDITDSAPVRTVRDAVNSIVQGSNVQLLELPGDEAILDVLINQEIPITSLNDLYAVSEYRIRQIIVDPGQGIVRVLGKPNTQRLYLIPDVNDVAATNDENTPAHYQQSVRSIIESIAHEHGLSILELPGDEALLDTYVTLDAPVREFKALYALPDNPIKHIYLDQSNQTIRVL